jgi:starch phosphorylase
MNTLTMNLIWFDLIWFVGRWLHQANPELSALITTYLRTDEWKSDLGLLSGLRKFADDEKFQKKWIAIKRRNKVHTSEIYSHTTTHTIH